MELTFQGTPPWGGYPPPPKKVFQKVVQKRTQKKRSKNRSKMDPKMTPPKIVKKVTPQSSKNRFRVRSVKLPLLLWQSNFEKRRFPGTWSGFWQISTIFGTKSKGVLTKKPVFLSSRSKNRRKSIPKRGPKNGPKIDQKWTPKFVPKSTPK